MKNYDKSFKEEAIKLSDEIGGKATSEKLGVPIGTIYSWRKMQKREVNKPSEKTISKSERAEYERKIWELEAANEILKKALPIETLEILQKHYHNHGWWDEE